MNCPNCKSHEVYRTPRKTVWDSLKSSVGLWPYLCESCGRKFTLTRRYPSARGQHSQKKSARTSRAADTFAGAEMASGGMKLGQLRKWSFRRTTISNWIRFSPLCIRPFPPTSSPQGNELLRLHVSFSRPQAYRQSAGEISSVKKSSAVLVPLRVLI